MRTPLSYVHANLLAPGKVVRKEKVERCNPSRLEWHYTNLFDGLTDDGFLERLVSLASTTDASQLTFTEASQNGLGLLTPQKLMLRSAIRHAPGENLRLRFQ